MQYFLTESTQEATMMIDSFDIQFKYPNGNALTYATIIKPTSNLETRMAVPIEDRCLPFMTSSVKNILVQQLPDTFGLKL